MAIANTLPVWFSSSPEKFNVLDVEGACLSQTFETETKEWHWHFWYWATTTAVVKYELTEPTNRKSKGGFKEQHDWQIGKNKEKEKTWYRSLWLLLCVVFDFQCSHYHFLLYFTMSYMIPEGARSGASCKQVLEVDSQLVAKRVGISHLRNSPLPFAWWNHFPFHDFCNGQLLQPLAVVGRRERLSKYCRVEYRHFKLDLAGRKCNRFWFTASEKLARFLFLAFLSLSRSLLQWNELT